MGRELFHNVCKPEAGFAISWNHNIQDKIIVPGK
jgi:hypothetical protein